MDQRQQSFDMIKESAPFNYNGEHQKEISFPLGGIGTGSIGLSGGGRLIDWEVLNRPAKGITNGLSHFAVKAERAGAVVDARILNGPYRGNRTGDFPADTSRNFGFGARRDSLAGMPHFADNTFTGKFPVAELGFTQDSFPGTVELTAFNPFIPMNDRDSSMPVAMFEIRFSNSTPDPLTYTAVGVLGHGLPPPTRAALVGRDGMVGVKAYRDESERDQPDFAEFVLATDCPEADRQAHLFRGHWFDALEVYWNELAAPGRFAPREYKTSDTAGGMGRNRDSSLAAGRLELAPGESGTVRFVIAWYAPIFRKYWVTPLWHFRQTSAAKGQWKNWYATEWASAEDIAFEALARWDALKADTMRFRDALYDSTLPSSVIDAAGANLSILKSPTTLRLESGAFYGWEGCHPTAGSCEGSCTHVWNYQQALPFLFPALERSMRELDYQYNMNTTGGMSFRLSLPLGTNFATERPCADGQFGNAIKVYRDWKLSGDDAWLMRLWPDVRRGIEYAWSPDNPDHWDPDRTGVLSGRQHHTLDMELFGPNSWLTSFYLGALKAGAEMAMAMGEVDAAKEFRRVYQKGRRWVDENLFNGNYYTQKIDISDSSILERYAKEELSTGVLGDSVMDLYWSAEHKEIKYQLGDGCLVDQVLGQWHATLYGLGDILDPDKTRQSLDAIYSHNFKPALGEIYNPCRVFGMYDEAGTVIATWPDPKTKPAVPVPYAQETMHGMEYAFGEMLMAYGRLAEGVEVFEGVRDRYDGANRNPWNEIECGSNYARSMASWGAIPVLGGFEFDASAGRIGFTPRVQADGRFQSFWSGCDAFGTVTFSEGRIELAVLGGTLSLEQFRTGLALGNDVSVRRGSSVLHPAWKEGALSFDRVELGAGDSVEILAPALSLRNLPDIVTL